MAIKQAVTEVKQPEPMNYDCKATGCPCAGGIGGVCRFHFGEEFTNWPRITDRLRSNEWLLRLLKFVRTEKHTLAHDDMIRHIKENTPEELHPIPGELPAIWTIRADSWLKKPLISKPRFHYE